jgi:predicted porin
MYNYKHGDTVGMSDPRSRVRAYASLSAVVLGLVASHADAQSSVTLFGSLNTGISYGQMPKNGGTALRQESISRSTWGLSGKEDLGGNYFATFKLSSRIDVSHGSLENMGDSDPNSRLFNAEATVGILAPWGQVRFGRALTPVQAYDYQVDPWFHYDSIASPAWYMGLPGPNALTGFYSGTPTGNFTGRVDNAVFYDSPNLSGLVFHGSAQITQSDGNHTRNLSFMAMYDQAWGGLGLGAERNSNGDKVLYSAAYAKFNTGQVGVSYGNASYKDPSVGGHTQSVEIAGSYILNSVHEFRIGFGRYFSAQANFLGLGYVYFLSKTTNIFVDAGYYKLGIPDYTGHTRYAKTGVGISHSF